MSFWCLFLDLHQITSHSTQYTGVQIAVVFDLGPSTLSAKVCGAFVRTFNSMDTFLAVGLD